VTDDGGEGAAETNRGRELPEGPEGFTRELARWSETLAAIARTGLGFSENLYERERFEEVLHVAADMKVAVNQVLGSTVQPEEATEIEREQDHFVQEWLESVGVGVPGYVTPKVAIGAIVGNDDGELLLVQRADSRVWLYPTGWADVGYSPAEVAVKEVLEETGIQAEVTRVVAVIDGQRMGFSRFGMYMLLFHLRAVGGELRCHPLECSDVGWFSRDALPEKTAGVQWWKDMAFNAIDGEPFDTLYDEVRSPIWRS
jgi:ADP-ribose pyrophosphatase YjhB (NUDIX family)